MKPKKAGRPIHEDGRAIVRTMSIPLDLSDRVDAVRGERGWSQVVVEALRTWLKKAER